MTEYNQNDLNVIMALALIQGLYNKGQIQLCYIYNAQRNEEAKKTNRIRCAFSFAKVNNEL